MILRAMNEREEAYMLRGRIQMDNVYLGEERPGGKVALQSVNKIPIVAAVSLNEAGPPIHARITVVSAFSSEANTDWAKRHLAPGSHVLSDVLACFCGVTKANSRNKAIVTGGKFPNDLPQFRWINPLLGKLKTSFSGTFNVFNLNEYARRYLGGYCFRFKRRFSQSGITEQIANAVYCCVPLSELDLRVDEAYG